MTQPVECPGCGQCIGEVSGASFPEILLLADALGVYHEPLCRAPREQYAAARADL